MRRLLLALGVAAISIADPAFCQSEYACTFQTHSTDPAVPAPGQPFLVTVSVVAQCIRFYPNEPNANVLTVDIQCWCGIATPPPPYLQVHTFEVPGLPAGPATIQFIEEFTEPPDLIYTFNLIIGSALEVPAIQMSGLVILGLLLLLAALATLRWRG
jgi:hypothetical protein